MLREGRDGSQPDGEEVAFQLGLDGQVGSGSEPEGVCSGRGNSVVQAQGAPSSPRRNTGTSTGNGRGSRFVGDLKH